MKRLPQSASFLHVVAVLALAPHLTYAQKFITFDAPGIDTTPAGITSSGLIIGSYLDTITGSVRGFLRNAQGTITPFDFPNTKDTIPTAIDTSMEIVGYYYKDPLGLTEPGFIRAANGTFISLPRTGEEDVLAGAEDVFPEGISPTGVIVGDWRDLLGYMHGFLRQPDGTVDAFIDPSSGQPPIDSEILAINPAGKSTGYYFDAGFDEARYRGFLRQADGTIRPFDVPNAAATYPDAINPQGEIAGSYYASGALHGFLRDSDGNITVFDVLNATNTFPVAIDSKGQIVGSYPDASKPMESHGFLRDTDGNITAPLDVPGSTSTMPMAMSLNGKITGVYVDSNGDKHGFLLIREGGR
jgi:hypothetical protein